MEAKRLSPIEFVSFCREDTDSFELKVMSLTELYGTAKDGLLFQPHRIGFFFVMLLTEGQGSHFVDNTWWRVSSGSVVILPAGKTHAFTPLQENQGRIVLFSRTVFQQLCDGIAGAEKLMEGIFDAGPVLNLPSEESRILEPLMEGLTRADFEVDPTLGQLYSSSRFLLFLLKLSSFISKNDWRTQSHPKDDRVSLFFELLEKNFRWQHKALFYANEVKVTSRTLDRILTSGCGRTAKALITERLMAEAKRLLLHSTMPVKSVAGTLGFSESSNFTRFFLHEEGLTPQEFRQRGRAN